MGEKHEIYAAAFDGHLYYDLFLQGGGGHGPLGSPGFATVFLSLISGFLKHICLTSLTRAKCGVRSTLCWKIPNISGSIELFAL